MIVGPVAGVCSDIRVQDPRGMCPGQPADPLATMARRQLNPKPESSHRRDSRSRLTRLSSSALFAPRARTQRRARASKG
jgi:hypothetical protein